MEDYVGDREAAADHETGHALIGTFENGWNSLGRAWIVEGPSGWGGGADFDRQASDPESLARTALAGTLAEGKRALERQGYKGDLADHRTHAQNVRLALNRLANDTSLESEKVEVHVDGQTTQAALSRQDAGFLSAFDEDQLTSLIKATSALLNGIHVWRIHGDLADRLLNPPSNEDPDINYTHVWQRLW